VQVLQLLQFRFQLLHLQAHAALQLAALILAA
jgi:hypothetical protein